ncbi:MAG: multicopper oxidase domain-containing protein [Gammaproteobacteria bacterium]|nr:multicopper oxidase domain-containing protein [Gammaproteobacteria bacterium]
MKRNLSRRDLLKIGGASLLGLPFISNIKETIKEPTGSLAINPDSGDEHGSHDGLGTVGQVDHERNGFNPDDLLYGYDYGTVSKLEDGQILREYEIYALDKEIEIAPGVFFPGWVYGSLTSPESQRAGRLVGRVPGPTIRCVEGERIRIKFINTSSHPHTIHFHGIHSARMDGVPGQGDGVINQGGSTVYEFDAFPFGCHLYHCHALPLARHIHKGLYGGFIVDPDPEKYQGEEREIAKTRNHQYPENKQYHEMFMLMNAFDTNFDKENEVYAVNSIAFAYLQDPIPITRDKIQRIYLVNTTEFDPINSIHIHANFFDYYDHGTTFQPTLKTVDTIMQCQAQRGILEFSFRDFENGLYMFHAHQSEFAELGWMGNFQLGSGA